MKLEIAKIIGIIIGYCILVSAWIFWLSLTATALILAIFIGFKLSMFLLGGLL